MESPYKIGDVVLMENPVPQPGVGIRRLATPFNRAYFVIDIIPPNTLCLAEDPSKELTKKVNMNKVKLAPPALQNHSYRLTEVKPTTSTTTTAATINTRELSPSPEPTIKRPKKNNVFSYDKPHINAGTPVVITRSGRAVRRSVSFDL